MIIYDSSINNLPDHVRVVYERNGLLQIREPGINLAIWVRDEDPSITDFVRELPPVQIEEDSRFFKGEVRELSKHPGRLAFLTEHGRLHKLMGGLQRRRNTYVFSVKNEEVIGYDFHQDDGYSLNWTLDGETGLWLPNECAKRENKDHKLYENPYFFEVRQFPPHSIVVYEGVTPKDRERFPDKHPLVHSRPHRIFERRALHQIYL